MSLLSRFCPALALALPLALLSANVHAADEPKEKEETKFKKETVTFHTVDGVDLHGTYWTMGPEANVKVTKNACVLLLHNFSRQKGGSRNDDGWAALGDELAKEGYIVLSFDFRGHGDSTTVAKEFWDRNKFPHNAAMLMPGTKANDFPVKFEYKDIKPNNRAYYPHFVDDVAAAKVFLDVKAGPAAGNMFVIGAGEGATIGAMWMSSQYRLYREKTADVNPQVQPAAMNIETEPEGKDLAGAVWLSLSEFIDGTQVPVKTWVEEVAGRRNKVPMAFLYPKEETNGRSKQLAYLSLQKIMAPSGYTMMGTTTGENKDPLLKYTRDWAIETKLEGSQMLQPSLNTTSIIKATLNHVYEDRANKENKRHEQEKYRYFWFGAAGTGRPTIAKYAGEEFIRPVDIKVMLALPR